MRQELRQVSDLPGKEFRLGWLKLKVDLKLGSKIDLPHHPTVEIEYGKPKFWGMAYDQVLFAQGTPNKSENEVDFGKFKFAVFQAKCDTVVTVNVDDHGFRSHFHTPGKSWKHTFQLTLKESIYDVASAGTSTMVETPLEGHEDCVLVVDMVYEYTGESKSRNYNACEDAQNIAQIMKSKIKDRPEESVKQFGEEFRASYPFAQEMVYLLIPGLFTEHYPLYFARNIYWLKDVLAFDYQVVQIDTDASSLTNAVVVREAVLKEAKEKNRKCVLIGHSKGGVDIGVCVTKYYEDVKDHVYGVITMQSPYVGTHCVDWVHEHHLLSKLAKSVIEDIWHGDIQALEGMSYQARAEYNEKYPYDGNKIPTVSLATCQQNWDFGDIKSMSDFAGISSMKMTAEATLEHNGFACDGLVAQPDARFPGADVIFGGYMFHTEPALNFRGSEFDGGPLTQILIELLFKKVERISRGELV